MGVLRAMPPTQYVFMQTAETLAAALILSPAMLLTFAVDGILSARFPRPVLGQPAAPIPQCVFAALSRRHEGSAPGKTTQHL